MIPTLIYSWQFYDLVELAANPEGNRRGFWLRASFVMVASLGIVVITLIRDYYTALATWYAEPSSGHFSPKYSSHYLTLT
jgi:hypothetical protein